MKWNQKQFPDIHEPFFISGKRAQQRNRQVCKEIAEASARGCQINPIFFCGSSQDCIEELKELLRIRKGH
jgi:hypothetical protein